jgi:cytochrome P450 family 1 subfamily A polypeptide 1
MIAGGINTSNYVVEWGLAELMHHKDIIKALQDEMDAVIGKDRLMREEDIANLPYLRATVKEILRFRPVVPLLPHHSINPCNINGFHIPTNTKVIINNWSLSMNEEYWDDPSQFRPQRFLDSNVDVKGHHYQLLPFGAGRRYCPAMNFSLTIIHLMLGSLIHCFKLSLPSEVDAIDMTEAFGLTMQMATPLVLVASPRFPSQFYESLVINQHI